MKNMNGYVKQDRKEEKHKIYPWWKRTEKWGRVFFFVYKIRSL